MNFGMETSALSSCIPSWLMLVLPLTLPDAQSF
jgi:hypothetical protein